MEKNEKFLSFYQKMLTIRLFEEKALELYARNKIKGSIHLCIGQEAVAVGVCSALDISKGDGITSNHRGHGHFIAMGGNIKYMMAELLGKSTGYCKGKGGSMHIADKDIGVYGANGIVGGGIAIACGLALSSVLKNKESIAVTFFGDGASNQGVLYESLNMSSVWNLPVIFICENNYYAQTTPSSQTLAGGSIAKRAVGFNVEGIEIAGNDVEMIYETAKYAADKARKEKKPILIEVKTYRFKGHWQGDPEVYRTKDEVKEWMEKCPIKNYEEKLISKYAIDRQEIEKIQSKVIQEINEAEKFALFSKEPDEGTLLQEIYA